MKRKVRVGILFICVIFVDEKTISPADIGSLVRALTGLSREAGKLDWIDRVYFLRRQR
jgi:hypothetical protein